MPPVKGGATWARPALQTGRLQGHPHHHGPRVAFRGGQLYGAGKRESLREYLAEAILDVSGPRPCRPSTS
jgi:hypothetical protein